MCLAIPGKIVEVNGDEAVIDYGSEKRAAKNLINAKVGELVMVQQKMIVVRLTKEQADELTQLWSRING